MGKDATKASDHKSTNALDGVDVGGTPIGFSFGSRTITLEHVPDMDETFVIMLKVQVKRDGNERNGQGELIPVRTVKILDGWEPGKKPTNGADPNQTEMYPIDPVDGSPAKQPDEPDFDAPEGDQA